MYFGVSSYYGLKRFVSREIEYEDIKWSGLYQFQYTVLTYLFILMAYLVSAAVLPTLVVPILLGIVGISYY